MRRLRIASLILFVAVMALGSQRQAMAAWPSDHIYIDYFVWLHPQCTATGSGTLLPGGEGGMRLSNISVECDDVNSDFCWSDPWIDQDAGWMCYAQCSDSGASDYDFDYFVCQGQCDCTY